MNRLKGRPADQVGSITAPARGWFEAWDVAALPGDLPGALIRRLVTDLFSLGPFGFRGPAAGWVPDTSAAWARGEVIGPGEGCPGNRFLDRARRQLGEEPLYVTSANRSRHATGADDSPAHWRAAGVRADLGPHGGLVVLEHEDDAVARLRYPGHLPVSTSILALHRVEHVRHDRRPQLVLERHGSLGAEGVRDVLQAYGFGLVLGLHAQQRLTVRSYPQGPCRLHGPPVAAVGPTRPRDRG